MTRSQALRLQEDWGSNITPEDFHETLYLSIKGIGSKIFKNCCYHEQDNYMFIWTKEESFLLDKKDLGDFVAVSDPHNFITSIQKTNRVT